MNHPKHKGGSVFFFFLNNDESTDIYIYIYLIIPSFVL